MQSYKGVGALEKDRGVVAQVRYDIWVEQERLSDGSPGLKSAYGQVTFGSADLALIVDLIGEMLTLRMEQGKSCSLFIERARLPSTQVSVRVSGAIQ